MEKMSSKKTTELAVDFRSVFHLCFTPKEPEEAEKVILATMRDDDYDRSSMGAVKSVPGSRQIANALTKDNPTTATKLEQVLQTGVHCHNPVSFVTTSDMPISTSGGSRGDGAQLSGECETSD